MKGTLTHDGTDATDVTANAIERAVAAGACLSPDLDVHDRDPTTTSTEG
jgi:hypothetical protein